MDQSGLDKKYFLTKDTYNCPYCKRGSINFTIKRHFEFDWSNDNVVHGYLVTCAGCECTSLHLSYIQFFSLDSGFMWLYDVNGNQTDMTKVEQELDDLFFYNQPTSFFTVDSKIPKIIRELITEAEGCLKFNYLVGSSGSLRKAIYELLKHQKALGSNYEDKIKWLKKKYPNIYPGYFDILANTQDMTSENLHEQEGDWKPWSAKDLRLLIATVKEVLYELFVTPAQQAKALDDVLKLKERSSFKKNNKTKSSKA